MSISEKITQYRKLRGLTQESLGDALGVTGQAVSKWESASALPDVSLLPRLCEALDVPPDELLEFPDDTRVRFLKAGVSRTQREAEGVDITSLLLDLIGRTFDSNGSKTAGNCLRMWDDFVRLRVQKSFSGPDAGECSFLLGGADYQRELLSVPPDTLAPFLDLFRDERTFAVLRETGLTEAVTSGELEQRTGIPKDELKTVLLDLVEMSVLEFGSDPAGKRGYRRGPGYPSVLMVLCAADACGCLGGPGINAVWLM
ncbi:MAG: helix-turn-helix transcriptional regulator [Ruminococcaceae bacterium]|nr:helix-turn-helix transcriptional regulator [Oscillospiraceae bacterium]